MTFEPAEMPAIIRTMDCPVCGGPFERFEFEPLSMYPVLAPLVPIKYDPPRRLLVLPCRHPVSLITYGGWLCPGASQMLMVASA